MGKILLIDDHASHADRLRKAFENESLELHYIDKGRKALALSQAEVNEYSAILVDLRMPDIDGLALLYKMTTRWKKVPPAFMFSFEEAERYRLLGLRLGVVDYLYKGMSDEEIILRLRNSLNTLQSPKETSKQLQFEDLNLDLRLQNLSMGDSQIDLTPTECRLLESVMTENEIGLSREMLLESVWGESAISSSALNSHIYNLNQKLKAFHLRIQIDRNKAVQIINESDAPSAKAA